MTCFFARNFASRDNSKHGSGIFVGNITATSGRGEGRVLTSDKQMVLDDLYSLVRTNTVRVKIDDQCDILATVSDTMAERDQQVCLKFSHNSWTVDIRVPLSFS